MKKVEYRPRLSQVEMDLISNHRMSNNVGIIGDTHEPFCHKNYRNFCYEVFDRFACGNIVHIGDEVDNAALSYHEKMAEMLTQKAKQKKLKSYGEVVRYISRS